MGRGPRLLGEAKKSGIGARDESPFIAETTIQDPELPECALPPRVIDRSLLVYTQQYPFCTGPDPALHRKCFAVFREHAEIRLPKVSRPIEPLDYSELVDEASIRVVAYDILD